MISVAEEAASQLDGIETRGRWGWAVRLEWARQGSAHRDSMLAFIFTILALHGIVDSICTRDGSMQSFQNGTLQILHLSAHRLHVATHANSTNVQRVDLRGTKLNSGRSASETSSEPLLCELDSLHSLDNFIDRRSAVALSVHSLEDGLL